MLPYIIGTILLIITLLIIGLILRKRVYDAVDRQEIWKMEIMNRNTAAELARIKGLNLSGETQEKFEAWKERWEFIVAQELPDVSDRLYEAEDAADRYRFSSANKIIQAVDQILHSIENDIEGMLGELNELLESEKTSREDIETVQPKMDELKQRVSQNHHKYGQSASYFIDVANELETRLSTYDGLVEAGNYIEAKTFVDQVKKDINNLEDEIEALPTLLDVCSNQLPQELDELTIGLREMENEGYRITSLGFEEEIKKYQQQLLDCIQSLGKGKVSDVQAIIAEIEDRMKKIYDDLEAEALARNYIENQVPSYRQSIEKLAEAFVHTKLEVDTLRKNYFFEDGDMEKYRTLEKSIAQSTKQLDELLEGLVNTDQTHAKLRSKLETGFTKMTDLEQSHQEFITYIRNIRKDEREAREKLSNMHGQINDLHRKLQKSNLPGIPNFIWSFLESSSEHNDKVLKILEKQPLDMGEVQYVLSEAETAIAKVVEQVDMMLDQAQLTERVIQYANRYRSKYPLLAAKLSESERLFRSYEYELSLEHAAKAIEEIEPGALKRIEENLEMLQV